MNFSLAETDEGEIHVKIETMLEPGVLVGKAGQFYS
jgi:hypothetical protein